MTYRFLLLVSIVAGLSSCTTMYKSGQTPDDVYFSPAPSGESYARVDQQRDGRYEDDYYDSDRYLRMKASRRNRWSSFDDDFFYWNNPTWNNSVYFNSFSNPWRNPWNNPWNNRWNSPWMGSGIGWNTGVMNPFMPGFYSRPVVIVTRPVNPKVYTPRGGNLGSYNNRYTTDAKTGTRTYNIASTPRNSSSSKGNYYSTPSYRPVRNISSSGSSNSTPSRSFSNGSSNSSNSVPRSSGGSSSGGSAPVRSFPRGGGN